MKHFLITYRLGSGSEEQRRREIATFIAALDADPALHGKVAYRAMKATDSPNYYHLATAADDDAVKALQSSAFFERYTAETDAMAEAEVVVMPLEMIAETA